MSEAEKLELFEKLIAPDVEAEEVLEAVLSEAEALILNKMFPFGYKEGTVIPARYENLHVQLAVEIYNKRGAEGQSAHGEQGISRSWPEKNRLLAMIVPHVGSVVDA